MASSQVTWRIRDGKSEWAGRLLADWLADLVAQVVATVQPAEVWLIGSLARGDDGPDSDIDLLVILDDLDPADSMALKQSLYATITVPAPFDAAFTTPQRFADRSKIPGTLERAAVREGRRVYART